MWNNNNMCPLTKDGYYSKNAIKLGLINSVSIFPVIRHQITQSIPGTSPRNHISVSWNYVEDRVTCNYSVTPSVIQGALWSDYSHTPKQSQHFTLSNCHPRKPWVTISLLNCLYVCLFVCVHIHCRPTLGASCVIVRLLLCCGSFCTKAVSSSVTLWLYEPTVPMSKQVSSERAVISFCGSRVRCLHFPPPPSPQSQHRLGLSDQRTHNTSEPDNTLHGQGEPEPCDNFSLAASVLQMC